MRIFRDKPFGGKIIEINLEPNDSLEDIAAYSHFTVQELIKEIEEILKKKED